MPHLHVLDCYSYDCLYIFNMNDKYTIEANIMNMTGICLNYAGYALIIEPSGNISMLGGDYCLWPMTEPRVFEVVDITKDSVLVDERISVRDKVKMLFKDFEPTILKEPRIKDWEKRTKGYRFNK